MAKRTVKVVEVIVTPEGSRQKTVEANLSESKGNRLREKLEAAVIQKELGEIVPQEEYEVKPTRIVSYIVLPM